MLNCVFTIIRILNAGSGFVSYLCLFFLLRFKVSAKKYDLVVDN